jgi:hypothetical protein
MLLGALALVSTVGTVSAMPRTDEGAGPAGAPASPPDIRPYLASLPAPAELSDAARPGFTAYRPSQNLPEYMVDDFEAPTLNDQLWLKIWDLDADPEEYGEYYWALSSCQSAPPGSQSLWGIGGGTNGSELPCGAVYPNGVSSGAIMRLDFTQYPAPAEFELIYDFFLNTRTEEMEGVVPDGLFLIFFYVNPENGRTEWVVIDALTSAYPKRFFEEPRKINLLAVQELYAPNRVFNLYDMKVVDFMYLFKTKRSPGGERSEGAFIDNIRIGSNVPPGEVTVTPTEPTTPTDTPEPTTETPTPGTETATPETPTPETSTPETGTPGTETSTPDTPTPPEDTPTPTFTPTFTNTPRVPPKPGPFVYLPYVNK